MNNTCYLVVGAESSGNRLMARILIAAGCHGYGDVFQPELSILLTESKEIDKNAVAVRSFPHGHVDENRHWPDIPDLVDTVRQNNYFPFPIIMLRDFYCTTASQPEAGHVRTMTKARQNIKKAYYKIFTGIFVAAIEHNYIHVTYEGLILHPQETINWLLPYIGLPAIEVPEEITDQNAKWYKK